MWLLTHGAPKQWGAHRKTHSRLFLAPSENLDVRGFEDPVKIVHLVNNVVHFIEGSGPGYAAVIRRVLIQRHGVVRPGYCGGQKSRKMGRGTVTRRL